MDFDPDSFRVSTWPRRTSVENSSPSRITHSAAVAPASIARRTMFWARDLKSVSVCASKMFSDIEIISPRRHGGTENANLAVVYINRRTFGSSGFTGSSRGVTLIRYSYGCSSQAHEIPFSRPIQREGTDGQCKRNVLSLIAVCLFPSPFPPLDPFPH